MARTVVNDYVIWAKNVEGDPRLVDRILKMRSSETIALVVDNVPGIWEKMADGANGIPVTGIKPVGSMKRVWRSIYRDQNGQVVEISAVEPQASAESKPRIKIEPPLASSQAERQAAWETFLSLGNAGWRSDKPYGSRDELYDR